MLTVDPDALDPSDLLDRERPSTSARLARSQFNAAARAWRVRRWHSRARVRETHRWFEVAFGLAVLAGAAVAAGVEALGAATPLAIAAGLPPGIAGVLGVLRWYFQRTTSVEAIVSAPPDSDAGVSEVVPLVEGKPQLGPLPIELGS